MIYTSTASLLPCAGQYMSPVRETAATRGVWRAFGLPRVAFVSTVFLCLLLFLAIFSAGRVHAQRSVRMEAAQPSIELLALNQLAALEAEIDAEIAAFPAPIATGRASLSAATFPLCRVPEGLLRTWAMQWSKNSPRMEILALSCRSKDSLPPGFFQWPRFASACRGQQNILRVAPKPAPVAHCCCVLMVG